MVKRINGWWMGFRFRQVLLELLISTCLACLVWLYTHHRARNSIEQVSVPVQILLSPGQQNDYTLETTAGQTVTVSFSGPHARIREVRRKLQRGLLKAALTFTIPSEKKKDEILREMVRIDEDCINVPSGVKVEIAEDSLPITVYRLTERTLPVRLEYIGDAHVSHIKIDPSSVRVRGPKVVLDRASEIATQPYAVQMRSSDTLPAGQANVRDEVALVSELEGRPIQTNVAIVQFQCRAVPKQKIYELSEVPIHFLCPKDCPWKPRFLSEQANKISLRLIGPVTDAAPPVIGFVDLTAGNLARGRNLQPLRLQLPKDFHAVDSAPLLVSFYLDEIERSTASGSKGDAE